MTEVELLKQQISLLIEENKLLKEHVVELERRLGLDSHNSSKPPSSDGLRKKPSPLSLRIKGQNPSGGQKGHKGHTLTQIDEATNIICHEALVCEICQASLSHVRPCQVIRRQVFDIPAPRLEVTEHQVEIKLCFCGHINKASFPASISAPVQYGDRVKALTIYLSNQQMIPEDRLQQVFKDLFELPISTATVAQINETFAQKITPERLIILEQLKKAPVKHADETGVRIKGKTQWLHVLSHGHATHYRVTEKRGALVEDMEGILIHDHWKPYFTLQKVKHGLCNAHHLRELKALEQIEKEPWAFKMSRLLALAKGITSPPVSRIGVLYDRIVTEGLAFHEKQPSLSKRKNKRRPGHNLLIRLRDFKDCVLRFLTTPNVPFTNNQAEQDIRMMKVKQKISGCFRTMRGAEVFCLIRGFLSTQRKQGLNLFSSIQLALA